MSDGAVNHEWLSTYFNRYRSSLFDVDVRDDLLDLRSRVLSSAESDGTVILAGNGGSASIADHLAVDLTKNAGIRALSFCGSPWVTCLANDYGFPEWISRSLEMYARAGDIVILISSSGRSENVLRAARRARELEMQVVTLSGFDADNPLRSLGELNFWVDSHAYNIVEMTHQIWLLAVCDAIIGHAEYPSA